MKPLRWILISFALALQCHGGRVSSWRVYKASDGLPETIVSSVSIGAHDRVWARHPNVDWAARLDGYEVDAIPSPGPGNTRIHEGPGGQIWNFGPEGLKSYLRSDPGWIRYNLPLLDEEIHKAGGALPKLTSIFPLRQNHVLMQLPDQLLEINTEDSAKPQTTIVKKSDDLGLGRFTGFAVAQGGILWLTGEKGLARTYLAPQPTTQPGEWNQTLLDESQGIHSLREPELDSQGNLMALGECSLDGRQKIVMFNATGWIVKPVPASGAIHAWRAPDGVWWLATHEALWSSSDAGEQFEKEDGLDAHRFYDIAVSSRGIFWAATSDGLYRHAPPLWQPAEGRTAANEASWGLLSDRNSNLWVGSDDGVWQLRSNSWNHFVITATFAPRSLLQISSLAIVAADGERLFKLDLNAASFSEVTNDHSNNIKALGILNDGRLLVQTGAAESNSSALLELYDGNNFMPYLGSQVPAQIRSNVDSAFQAQNNDVWLCGADGLARFDGKTWQVFSNLDVSGTGMFSCIVENGGGVLWFGIQDKIVQFDGNTWATVRAGFDHIHAMLKSRDGSVWVAADNGVHRFYHGSWCANGEEEGLPKNPVNALAEDHEGRICASTAQGLFVRHPEADAEPPRTFAQRPPSPSASDDTLSEGSIVTISFSGLDKWKCTPTDKLLYAFQLDGRNWSPYQEQRSVTFLDLAIGTHTFHVRSMDRNWNEDPVPAVLEFVIAPPWYKESRLVVIVTVCGCVAAFFAALAYNRHRRLLKSYAEVGKIVEQRTRELDLANRELFHSQKMNALGTLAAGVAHDFNNILSIIKGSTQIIEENLANPEKIRTRTGRIKTVVEQGSGIVRAMLGFSRTSGQQLALCKIDEIVRDTITLLGDRYLREVHVEFQPGPAGIPETVVFRDFIQQILINFILNAAEAMAGKREIILRTNPVLELPANPVLKPAAAAQYILLSVQDFGTGISPETMPRIFEPFFTTKSMSTRRGTGLGLSMVYQLAERMDCGISVISTPGEGSTFTLIIPVRENLPPQPENSGSKLSATTAHGNQ